MCSASKVLTGIIKAIAYSLENILSTHQYMVRKLSYWHRNGMQREFQLHLECARESRFHAELKRNGSSTQLETLAMHNCLGKSTVKWDTQEGVSLTRIYNRLSMFGRFATCNLDVFLISLYGCITRGAGALKVYDCCSWIRSRRNRVYHAHRLDRERARSVQPPSRSVWPCAPLAACCLSVAIASVVEDRERRSGLVGI